MSDELGPTYSTGCPQCGAKVGDRHEPFCSVGARNQSHAMLPPADYIGAAIAGAAAMLHGHTHTVATRIEDDATVVEYQEQCHSHAEGGTLHSHQWPHPKKLPLPERQS